MGAGQVRDFDSVSVGQEVAPVTIDVTRAGLAAYAQASGDLNPIHQNEEFAKGVGLPDVIAHGMWTLGAAGTVVANWAGDAGRVVSFRTRFSSMVVVPVGGTQIEVSATVTAVDPQARTATLDVVTTCLGAKVLTRCIATVALA